MWACSYPIQIITTKGSWYEIYANALQKCLEDLGFISKLNFTHEEVIEDSIVFYLSYQKIVAKEFIDKTYKSLVVHASDLPKGKGFSPWVWQILEEKNSIPVCLFEIDEGLDTGPILSKRNLELQGGELLEEIRIVLANLIENMIVDYLRMFEEPKSIDQVGDATFYKRRTARDSELDITKTLKDQFNLLRVVDNNAYPAYFHHEGRKYIIKIEVEND